jgi:hypothetical protein
MVTDVARPPPDVEKLALHSLDMSLRSLEISGPGVGGAVGEARERATSVLQSADLLIVIFALLGLEDGAAAAVCTAWRTAWRGDRREALWLAASAARGACAGAVERVLHVRSSEWRVARVLA